MKPYTKRILTWVMALALLVGTILTDYRLPVFSRAEETTSSAAAGDETTGGETTGSEAAGDETAGDKATGDETTDIETTDTESKEELPEEGLLIRANEDITRYVNVKLKDMAFATDIKTIAQENGKDKYIIKDGQLQKPVPKMGDGEGIMIQYTWSIPDKYMKQVKPGNHFTIQLPNGNVLKESDVPERPIINKQGKQVGKFTVKNGVLTATFTEDMSGNDRLKDGTFKVFSKLQKSGGHILIPKEYAESDKIEFDIIPGGGGGNSSNPLEKEHHSHKNVAKDAWRDNFCKERGLLGFNIWVNDKEFSNIYSGKEPTKKENVVVIDELPDGLGDFHSFEIMARVLAPKLKNGEIDPGKASRIGLLYPRLLRRWEDGNSNGKCGCKLYERSSTNDSDWVKFQGEIKEKGKTHVAVGLWKKTDNQGNVIKSKLIAVLGDLPGNITYGNLYDNNMETFEKDIAKGFKDEIEKWQGITLSSETKQKMTEVVKGIYNKKIAAYQIVFRAYITDKNKTLFTNKVDMNWGQHEKESDETSKVVSEAEGNIDYENDTVTISVEKSWIGPKKDKVILQLKDGDTVKDEIELNAGNQWKGKFKPVRKYRNQELINYKVVEKDVPKGYKESYEGSAANGYVKVTNTLAKTRVEIYKLWKDSQGTDTEAPVDEITVYLYRKAKGVEDPSFKQEVKILKSKNWETVVEDLDKYDDSFNEYEYFLKEENVPGYKSTYDPYDVLDKLNNEYFKRFRITNKEKPGNVNLEIDKSWVAFDGTTPLTPTDNPVVTVKIYKNVAGVKNLIDTAILNRGNNWHYSKTGLPKYEKAKKVEYSVEEISVSGYTNIKNDKETTPDGDYKFKLVNKLNRIPKIKIEVEKQWEKLKKDGHTVPLSDKYKKKLPSVEVELIKNGRATGKKETLSYNNGYKAEFNDLDEFNPNGSKVVYSVKELNPPAGFKVKVNPVTVSNNKALLVNQKEEKLIKISVEKKWFDEHGNPKTNGLPESITVNIIAKNNAGTELNNYNRSLTLYRNKNWKGSLDNLPAETEDGDAISYSAQEITVPGYLDGKIVPNQDSNGNYSFTVTNKEIPKTEIKVEKKWQNENGGKLPENHKRLLAVPSITVELIKDGAATGDTRTLTKANGWKESFTGLDKTKADGTEIKYSVKETVVPNGFDAVTNPTNAVNGTATIINKLKPNNTNITVTKKWVGINSGQPEVTLKLVQSINGGAFTDVPNKSIKLPHNGNWNYTFNNLPVEDEFGNEIKYEVREDNIPAGYSRSYENSYTVVNTKIDKISINVEKKWLTDNGNTPLPDNYNLIPDQIEVELLANGASMNPVKKITLKKSEGWKGTFTGLDKTDNLGNIIKYTVKETAKQNHFDIAVVADVDSNNNAVIKNIQTKENTAVKITKVWKDKAGNAVAGNTANKVKFELYYNDNGNEKIVKSDIVLPTADGKWEYTVSGLTKYDQEGKLIQYKLREIEVPEGYHKLVTDDGNFNFTATNQEIPTINIKVEKRWVDKDGNKLPDDYKLIPDSLEIRLLANGVPVLYKGQASVKVLKSSNWKYEFTDLYELDENGKTIKYSVEEILTAKDKESFVAESPIVEVNNKEAVLINKKSDERVNVAVKKIWKDLSNNDITTNLPSEIILKLVKIVDGQPVPVQEIKLPVNGKWETVITNLAKYDAKGERIVYKIIEENVPDGYFVEYGTPTIGPDSSSFIVTNRMVPKVNIDVEKKWVNKDGAELPNGNAQIPDSIRVKLMADGKDTGKIIELKKSEGWTGRFTDLDKKDKSGRDIVYTIEEIMPDKLNETFVVSDKTAPTEANNYKAVITNKNTDQKVRVKIKKVWTDENGSDITASIPDNVEVLMDILKYDGKIDGHDAYSPVKQNIKISKATNWSFESDLLPKFDKDGKEIKYFVREVEVPSGYRVNSKLEENAADNTFTFTMTNQIIPKTKIDVEKRWIDKDNNPLASTYQRIPEKVTVRLLANGHEIKTLDILKSNGWKGSFTDLPLTDMYHNKITYKVEEVNVPEGFVIDSTKAENGTVVITNKKVDETVKLNVRKIWLDRNNNSITNANVLPQFVKLQLLADGVSKGSFYVYKDKGFVWTSENLAKYDADGKEISYTIKELDGTYGYSLTSINKSTNGLEFTVTNTERPNTPPYIPPAPSIPDEPIPTPPATPTPPPAPNTPPEDVTIEDDEVVLTNNDEEKEEPSEEITDDLPKVNRDIPKTTDYLLGGFANSLAVATVLMMGFGIKKLVDKKKKD